MSACCDGTGWTGNPKAPCPEHYEPMTGWFELAQRDADRFDDYGPNDA